MRLGCPSRLRGRGKKDCPESEHVIRARRMVGQRCQLTRHVVVVIVIRQWRRGHFTLASDGLLLLGGRLVVERVREVFVIFVRIQNRILHRCGPRTSRSASGDGFALAFRVGQRKVVTVLVHLVIMGILVVVRDKGFRSLTIEFLLQLPSYFFIVTGALSVRRRARPVIFLTVRNFDELALALGVVPHHEVCRLSHSRGSGTAGLGGGDDDLELGLTGGLLRGRRGYIAGKWS